MNSKSEFSLERINAVKALINASTTFSVIGIPGIGISVFLKYISNLGIGKVVYIDVFGLPNLTPTELFNNLLLNLGSSKARQNEGEVVSECKILLEKLVKEKNEKIIICFGGFDQLKNHFNQKFFHLLRTLRNIDQKKIIFIFGICRRIESLVSEDLMDTDLSMIAPLYYLKPYSKEELVYLLSIYGPRVDIGEKEFKETLSLSGGHFQLLQLLLRSERIRQPLNDPFINLALKNIYHHLTYMQKKIIQKIAQTGSYIRQDEYLSKVGLIRECDGKFELFSEIFTDYVRSQASLKLSVKEAKLYKLLKQNIGKTVAKDQIFNEIWQNDLDNATDWALDSLIYRLRKNPTFVSQGYIIESYKKLGYMLVKNLDS